MQDDANNMDSEGDNCGSNSDNSKEVEGDNNTTMQDGANNMDTEVDYHGSNDDADVDEDQHEDEEHIAANEGRTTFNINGVEDMGNVNF
ncbi:hypothetical protein A2U01_0079092, partial [Trifolium medium]|nr:hypothetical protein [Trifolium medium]